MHPSRECIVFIGYEPARSFDLWSAFGLHQYIGDIPCALAECNGVTVVYACAGFVESFAIDEYVSVADQLPCCRDCRCESKSEQHVVEPLFEEDHQVVACATGQPVCFCEQFAELPFTDAIVEAHFLFFSQEAFVLAGLGASEGRPVLPRWEGAFLAAFAGESR